MVREPVDRSAIANDNVDRAVIANDFVPRQALGSLNGCLIDGDAAPRSREHRLRCRSLAISIALQSAALAALILVPLFGKPQHIALANIMPIPPYSYHAGASRSPDAPPTTDPHPPACRICFSGNISPTVPTHSGPTNAGPISDSSDPPLGPDGPERPGLLPPMGDKAGPQPSQIIINNTEIKKRIVVGYIEPAMLTRRIEPIYPILAKQTGRSGRVELRAIISIDGSIQSLQVVEGDMLFV